MRSRIVDGAASRPGLPAPRPFAVYCMLEVGQGAPVNFIYFQF